MFVCINYPYLQHTQIFNSRAATVSTVAVAYKFINTVIFQFSAQLCFGNFSRAYLVLYRLAAEGAYDTLKQGRTQKFLKGGFQLFKKQPNPILVSLF